MSWFSSDSSIARAVPGTALVFYTEGPPTSGDVVSTGLSRANRHIFDAVSDCVVASLSVSFNVRRPIRDDDLHPPYRRANWWVFRFGMNLPSLLPLMYRLAGKDWRIPARAISRTCAHLQGVSGVVVATIGADAGAVARARVLASAAGKPLVIYLVDDPISNAELTGKSMTDAQIRAYTSHLSSCQAVLCITRDLADLVASETGVNCAWADLPYERLSTAPPYMARTSDVVFVGNASHFYQDGLADCAQAVSLCRQAGTCVRLVCTIDSPFLRELQSRFGSDAVHISPCPTDHDLDCLLASALMAFVPYSFDEKYRRMVVTSYPSKLTEYLCSAMHILVYAPDYSSASKIVRAEVLDSLVSVRAVDRIAETILQAARKPVDHSSRYREVLARKHNLKRFRDAVLAAARSGDANASWVTSNP